MSSEASATAGGRRARPSAIRWSASSQAPKAKQARAASAVSDAPSDRPTPDASATASAASASSSAARLRPQRARTATIMAWPTTCPWRLPTASAMATAARRPRCRRPRARASPACALERPARAPPPPASPAASAIRAAASASSSAGAGSGSSMRMAACWAVSSARSDPRAVAEAVHGETELLAAPAWSPDSQSAQRSRSWRAARARRGRRRARAHDARGPRIPAHRPPAAHRATSAPERGRLGVPVAVRRDERGARLPRPWAPPRRRRRRVRPSPSRPRGRQRPGVVAGPSRCCAMADARRIRVPGLERVGVAPWRSAARRDRALDEHVALDRVAEPRRAGRPSALRPRPRPGVEHARFERLPIARRRTRSGDRGRTPTCRRSAPDRGWRRGARPGLPRRGRRARHRGCPAAMPAPRRRARASTRRRLRPARGRGTGSRRTGRRARRRRPHRAMPGSCPSPRPPGARDPRDRTDDSTRRAPVPSSSAIVERTGSPAG